MEILFFLTSPAPRFSVSLTLPFPTTTRSIALAKTRKAGARREQILKAAETIFAEKGFHETTISDIAKSAGLSEPTLYEY
ncbi:MAG: helix-turn-helix domain-containing protein, partial [Desulfatitalea sp.]